MTPEGLQFLWRQIVGLKSPVASMWMRGIYVASMTYEGGKLAHVYTRSLPQYSGDFRLTTYSRGLLMDALEELVPGAVWAHEAKDSQPDL